MVWPFKKKMAAGDYAITLGQLALDPSRAERFLNSLDSLEINSQEEKNQILSAIMMLQVFATDYAVTLTLGKGSPEKNAVLDHFYNDLKKITTRTTAGLTFYDALKEVLLIYTTALQTPHEQGPFYNIGKEFADLCGKKYDPATTFLGSTLFTHTVDTVSKMLKKFPVKI
jgi:hypothetical protein